MVGLLRQKSVETKRETVSVVRRAKSKEKFSNQGSYPKLDDYNRLSDGVVWWKAEFGFHCARAVRERWEGESLMLRCKACLYGTVYRI